MSLTEKVMCPDLPALIHAQEYNYKNLYAVCLLAAFLLFIMPPSIRRK